MEFNSVHNYPHSSSPLNDVNGNFDMFESSRGCDISAGYILTSSDEANEKIGGYVERMGQSLLDLPSRFVSCLKAIGSFFSGGAVSTAQCTALKTHKAGYILKHSEDKVWDEDVWKAKRKTDFVKELLTVSNKDEIGQVAAAKELITGLTDNDINNVAAAKELFGISRLSDLAGKKSDEVAGKLVDNMGSMPEVHIIDANKLIVSTLGSWDRREINDWLQDQNSNSELVQITKAFLALSNAKIKQPPNSSNPTSSLSISFEDLDGNVDESRHLLSSNDDISDSEDDPIPFNLQPDNNIPDTPLATDEARVLAILKKAIESEKIVRLQEKLYNSMTLENVDDAVTVLMYKLDSIPEIRDEEAKKLIGSVLKAMNRAELNAWLQTQDQQSPLVKIALAFLEKCTGGDGNKPFSINEVGILSMLRNAIEAQQAMELKQKLALLVTNDDLSQLNVDDAVKVLMYELDKMPLAPNIDDTLMSREQLVAQLKTIPQTRLVEIALKFLEQSCRGNSKKPLNNNEWTIVSALTGGIAAKQKMEAKQNQRALNEEGKQLQELRKEYKALYNKKYEACCIQLKKENTAFKITQNANNLKTAAEKRLEADEELKAKFAEVEDASDKLDTKNRANIKLQSELKIAENLEAISFFAWNKLSHADAITYLDGQTKHEFLPGYSLVKVKGLTGGVDFGLKKLIPGEPNAFVGGKLGITYTDNYFADDENYLGHVTGQWNIVGTLLFRAGWDIGLGTSPNANLTRSFRARYAEWGTEHLRNVHQFTDKGRANANNNEQYGHHYDSQVNKFKDDPDFKPFLSRRARLGMDNDSYLNYEDWDEVTRIDLEKLKFDTTEKKKEGDMQVQNSLALTSTTYTQEQLDRYAVEPSQETKDRIKKDKFHMRESTGYEIETSKENLKPVQKDLHNIRESFRENAKSDISELKRQRDRVLEDVELELDIIKEQCLKDIDANLQAELNSTAEESKESVKRAHLKHREVVKDQLSKLEEQLNLIKINKRQLKEHRINRLNEIELVLNRLDPLVGNDISEKIKPLIAELYILLAEKVDEKNDVGLRYEMIGSDEEPWISDLIFELDHRKKETIHSRQHRFNEAIIGKECELRINELKLKLLFELLPLNSQFAAGIIAQLIGDLKLQERDLPVIQNPSNQDDGKAQKLAAIYEFKIHCVNKQVEIQKVKLKRDLEIAALKREYAGKIAQVYEEASQQKPSFTAEKEKSHIKKVAVPKLRHVINPVDFEVAKMLDQDEKSQEESSDDLSQVSPKKATKEELTLRAIENLEQERDKKIREKQKEALLAEADLDLQIKLAGLATEKVELKQELTAKFTKETEIKKRRIEDPFQKEDAKQEQALKLAEAERQWDLKSVKLEYKQAAEARKAQLEYKQAALRVKYAFIPDNGNNDRRLQFELRQMESEYERKEGKIQEQVHRVDPRILEGYPHPTEPILKLVDVIKQALENSDNITLEAVLQEVNKEVKIPNLPLSILGLDKIIKQAYENKDNKTRKAVLQEIKKRLEVLISILKLDPVVEQLIANKGNKTAAEVLEELRVQTGLNLKEIADNQAKDLYEQEHERDLVFAVMDEVYAAEIRKIEKDLKVAELKHELSLVKHDNNKADAIQAKIDILEIQFMIDELRHQRDFDIETLSDEEILTEKRDKTEKDLIEEFGPTLGLMKIYEAKTKPLEEELQQLSMSADPWAQVIDAISEFGREMYPQLEKLANSDDPIEAEKNKAELTIRKLAIQTLIKLLPLQSQTAVELRKELIEYLNCAHLFTTNQLKVTSCTSEDEKAAQKIRTEFYFAIFNLNVECERNLENINYPLLLKEKLESFTLKDKELEIAFEKALKERTSEKEHNEEQIKELKNELGKPLGQARLEYLQFRYDEEKKHFDNLSEINAKKFVILEDQKEEYQRRLNELTQAEKKKKDDEQAWTKDYLSWIPVPNQPPISFTNTGVEHNGAYLADYYTWSAYGSGGGDGSTDDIIGFGGALDLSGRRRYTNLTREKFTFLCDMLGNLYKPMEEKKGIARLLDEQLNSEPPKTTMEKVRGWWGPKEKPASIKEIIIAGWQENNLFSYQPNAVSKKPVSITSAEGITSSGYSVDKSYFTVENALRCVTQDMISIIDLQTKAESENESIRKGTQEALAILQKRYAARNMHELVRNMAYFIASLRVLSGHGGDYNVMNPIQVAVDKKPTKEIIELQGQIKAAETMLFERVKVEKKEYWRECGVEESQIVSVTLRQGTLKGRVGFGVGPVGAYGSGSFRVEHFKRRHVMETRNASYIDMTGTGGFFAGFDDATGLVPSSLQDTIKDGWNHLFSDGDLSQDGSSPDFGASYTVDYSKTVRFHWLRRFEGLYKELGYNMEWFPTYTRPLVTTETKYSIGGSVPLDKIIDVPIHPNAELSATTTEIRSKNERWRGKSHNHPLMHYMHANHVNDIDRNTGKVMRPDCFWATSRIDQREGFAELYTSSGSQQWELTHKKTPTLNELHAREVEFKRNSLLDPALFRNFKRAKAHQLRVTKYYDVLHNSQKRIADRNAQILKLQEKNVALDKELTVKTDEQIDWIDELDDKNIELNKLPLNDRRATVLKAEIDELEKNIEGGKEIIAQLEKKIIAREQKSEQKIETLKKIVERISTTLLEARMFFREKNIDPNCVMKEFAHNYCQESLEAMYHAYFPQDYSLLLNAELYNASTMAVNGQRKTTYNKKAVLKAAMSGKKATVPQNKFVRDDVNFYNDPDSYHHNLHEAYYTNYAFK
jgi:hypothetical protein